MPQTASIAGAAIASPENDTILPHPKGRDAALTSRNGGGRGDVDATHHIL
jgi:hypothetical protein